VTLHKQTNISAVLDFALIELLLITRLPIRIKLFMQLIIYAVIASISVVFSLTILALRLLHSIFDIEPINIVTLIVIIILLFSLNALYSDLLGIRKNVVTQAPNRKLFRALNFQPSDVHLVYVVAWRLPLYSALFATCSGAAIILSSQNILTSILLIFIPLLLYFLHYSLTRLAIIYQPQIMNGRTKDIAIGVITIILAILIGLVAREQLANFSGDFLLLQGVSQVKILISITLIILSISLVAYFYLRLKNRELGEWFGFAYQQIEADPPTVKKYVSIKRIVSQGWFFDLRRLAALKIVTIFIFGVTLVAVIWVNNIPFTKDIALLRTILLVTETFTILSISEAFLTKHGLVAQLTRARMLWELGLSKRTLILAHNFSLFEYFCLIGGFAGFLGYFIDGLNFGVSAFLIPFSVGFSCIIADTLIPPIKNVDGSLSQSALASLVALLLTLPSLAIFTLRPPAENLLALILLLSLSGGLVFWQAQSLSRLTLNSIT